MSITKQNSLTHRKTLLFIHTQTQKGRRKGTEETKAHNADLSTPLPLLLGSLLLGLLLAPGLCLQLAGAFRLVPRLFRRVILRRRLTGRPLSRRDPLAVTPSRAQEVLLLVLRSD